MTQNPAAFCLVPTFAGLFMAEMRIVLGISKECLSWWSPILD